jgi:DNA-binding MarR family transcriptional regulator
MGMSIKKFANEMSGVIPKLHAAFLRGQLQATMTSATSFQQIVILNLILGRTQCKMSEMAGTLSVTTSAVTGMVDRMVRAGLLKRVRDPADRRIINIRLTTKGKKTINTILKERQKLMTGIFKNFTPKERETYLNIMKKMYAILTKEKR